MNITPTNIAGEYIDSTFTTITLPTQLSSFYSLLYPSNTETDILTRTNAYTQLIVACKLDQVFKQVDPRIAYTLQDLAVFQTTPPNLISVASSVIGNITTTNMLNYNTNYPLYLDIYENGTTNLQKLAGLICNYSYKLG
jgi:hypothetical protein